MVGGVVTRKNAGRWVGSIPLSPCGWERSDGLCAASAGESGAEAAAVQTLRAVRMPCEPRGASGLRAVDRRFRAEGPAANDFGPRRGWQPRSRPRKIGSEDEDENEEDLSADHHQHRSGLGLRVSWAGSRGAPILWTGNSRLRRCVFSRSLPTILHLA
jgi:hypothetical protein